MSHRFSKVGSTEQIFSLKNLGLWNKILPKLVCLVVVMPNFSKIRGHKKN